MNIGDLFPSRYLRASDITRPITVTISGLKVEDVAGTGDPADEKPVLFFKQSKRGLVLNKTNARIIELARGPEIDQWVGREIVLFQTETDLRGQRVPCIRVRVDEVGGPEAGEAGDPDETDIPF